jgi:hypothetical protein
LPILACGSGVGYIGSTSDVSLELSGEIRGTNEICLCNGLS